MFSKLSITKSPNFFFTCKRDNIFLTIVSHKFISISNLFFYFIFNFFNSYFFSDSFMFQILFCNFHIFSYLFNFFLLDLFLRFTAIFFIFLFCTIFFLFLFFSIFFFFLFFSIFFFFLFSYLFTTIFFFFLFFYLFASNSILRSDET